MRKAIYLILLVVCCHNFAYGVEQSVAQQNAQKVAQIFRKVQIIARLSGTTAVLPNCISGKTAPLYPSDTFYLMDMEDDDAAVGIVYQVYYDVSHYTNGVLEGSPAGYSSDVSSLNYYSILYFNGNIELYNATGVYINQINSSNYQAVLNGVYSLLGKLLYYEKDTAYWANMQYGRYVGSESGNDAEAGTLTTLQKNLDLYTNKFSWISWIHTPSVDTWNIFDSDFQDTNNYYDDEVNPLHSLHYVAYCGKLAIDLSDYITTAPELADQINVSEFLSFYGSYDKVYGGYQDDTTTPPSGPTIFLDAHHLNVVPPSLGSICSYAANNTFAAYCKFTGATLQTDTQNLFYSLHPLLGAGMINNGSLSVSSQIGIIDIGAIQVTPDDKQCCTCASVCTPGKTDVYQASLHMSISLGAINDDNDGGGVYLDALSAGSRLYNLRSLNVVPANNPLVIYQQDSSGLPVRINTPMVTVNFQQGSSGYTISFAHLGQTTAYETITVENPDSSGATTNKVRITVVNEGKTKIYNCTCDTSASDSWDIATAEGDSTVDRDESLTTTWNSGNTQKTVLQNIYNGSHQLTSSKQTVWQVFPWGTEGNFGSAGPFRCESRYDVDLLHYSNYRFCNRSIGASDLSFWQLGAIYLRFQWSNLSAC
ncbi:MAG: hypothetical protein QM796_10820 [Chthoniobacteraceae bacterium]